MVSEKLRQALNKITPEEWDASFQKYSKQLKEKELLSTYQEKRLKRIIDSMGFNAFMEKLYSKERQFYPYGHDGTKIEWCLVRLMEKEASIICEELDKLIDNSFTSKIYIKDQWLFSIMHGQGSCAWITSIDHCFRNEPEKLKIAKQLTSQLNLF